MDTNSGLAAVLAAATTAPIEAAAPAAAIAHTYTAADLQAAFPDLCATIRAEGLTAGATAERERILGIDAIGITGHDALVATMKADPAVSVADAGLRILRAEQSLRGQHLQAVKDVEGVAGAVLAAPLAGAAATAAAVVETASTPDGWKAEFEASEALRGEFVSADNYIAFKKADAAGRVRILGAKKNG